MEKEMIGQQFGRLTVIADMGRRKRKQFWLCECSCGNVKAVEEHHLTSGHTRSCGCYRRDVQKKRGLDLTGERYGRLLVLGPAVDKNGAVYGWKCRCDCGNECVCRKSNLRSGVTKSCGCLQEEQRKENMRRAIHFVEGTCVERIASGKTFASNTTGHRGVYRRENNRWRASIGFQGKVYNLGSFASFDDAVQARLKAEETFYKPFLEKYKESMGASKE